MSAEKSLDALRLEIDEIDNAIHDLIMRRTRVVESVRDIKAGERVKIRPSREAEILYRLVGRHSGAFPKRELVRIWRELIVATLGFEGPFSVAACVPDEGPGCFGLARDQYGAFTPIEAFSSPRRVIEAVRDGAATVGILPLPGRDDNDPWWPALMSEAGNTPRVVARLPFAGQSNYRANHQANNRDADIEGLVICPIEPQPTGRDHSCLVIELDNEISLTQMDMELTGAGLHPVMTTQWHTGDVPGLWLYMVTVQGFVAMDDAPIKQLQTSAELGVRRILSIGAYATPLSRNELDNEAAETGNMKS